MGIAAPSGRAVAFPPGLPAGQAEPPPLRVLVVHAQTTFGEALACRLARSEELEVLGAVARAPRALALVAARSVQTVVLDWAMVADDGGGLVRQLQALDEPPCLVALGSEAPASAVVGALVCGARAWVPQSSSVATLMDALRRTARGETWLPGDVLGDVIGHLLVAQSGPSPSPLDCLTKRERDVLACMVGGLDQSAIASRLFLSPNTVRTHRRRTLAKLGVHSSLEAVFVARRAGLGPPARSEP